MKIYKLLSFLAVVCLFNSCSKDLITDPQNTGTLNADNQLKSQHLPLSIAIVSDIHYLDASLMKNDAANGKAFQDYLAFDPKLIEYSIPIFEKVVSDLRKEKPDILLIPGDLTKDGEKLSHLAVAKILHKLSREGIKVFVIPGNHDVNNPESVGYNGPTSFPAETVSAGRFAAIYDEFGYRNAKYCDPNSLSYICQPNDKVWILGIDACKYEENTDKAIVSGRIKPETMSWIKDKMKKAKKEKVTVLAMMHHGIMEHYVGQNDLDPGYVVDDWKTTAEELMAMGIQVVFTGHYHANDVTEYNWDNKTLYDVETGSLVTAPCPYRLLTLCGDKLNISTVHVESIPPFGSAFVAYSNQFLLCCNPNSLSIIF